MHLLKYFRTRWHCVIPLSSPAFCEVWVSSFLVDSNSFAHQYDWMKAWDDNDQTNPHNVFYKASLRTSRFSLYRFVGKISNSFWCFQLHCHDTDNDAVYLWYNILYKNVQLYKLWVSNFAVDSILVNYLVLVIGEIYICPLISEH